MKISPIDIRQHTFEKGFRGYNIDEVNAFLNSLSQEWERVVNENKMLKMQLEIAEKELNKLKDIEMTLFRTLKTAEDTSQQITEQANKAAEKYLGESRQKSDETVNEAKRKASMLIQDAENEAKYIKEEIINELKNQERDFKAMEKYRDNLIVQLKSLVNNTNETLERFEKKFSKESSFAQKLEEIKQNINEVPVNPSADDTDYVLNEEVEVVDSAGNEENSVETVIEVEDNASEDSEVEAEEKQDALDENVEVPAVEESKVGDAASDALAEVNKLAATKKTNQKSETVTGSKLDSEMESNQTEPAENETKGKGSFFDQIR